MRKFSSPLWAALFLVSGLAANGPLPVQAQEASALDKTIADVSRRWPNLRHTSADEVTRMLAEKSAVLFDVRTEDEYRVSHIEGAIRVDLAIDSAEFLAAHAAAVKDKSVVFYCSVGVRSSKLAERVGQSLKDAGALSTHNLRGGIFAWHQEARPLVDNKGPIDYLHPYDAAWGRAVKRQDMISTEGRK